MTTPSCSVVICAYTERRWADLEAAIASVRAQAHQPDEIIVVVDHNATLLERVGAAYPGVRAVANSRERGLGGARNSGVVAATGAIVTFLDDDALATSDWLAQLLAGYADPRVLGVGGLTEPAWEGGRPRWFPAEFNWVIGCTHRGMPEQATVVRNLHGCNMSYRRELFDAVGGFRLGYGCDETEFCIRLGQRRRDGMLLHQPLARAYHRVPAERGRWRYFQTRCFFEGRSKAVVAWLVGGKDGLAAERAHTMRTLPTGVLRALADVAVRRDPSGLARAAAIVAGFAITTAGYLSGCRTVVEAARERGWSEASDQPATVPATT